MARAHRQHSVESAADVRKGRHKSRRQPSRPAAGRLLGFSAQRIRPCRTRRTQPSTTDAAQMRGLRSECTEVRFKSGQRRVRQRAARRRGGADRRINAFCLSHEAAAGYEWGAVKEMARCCGHFFPMRDTIRKRRVLFSPGAILHGEI